MTLILETAPDQFEPSPRSLLPKQQQRTGVRCCSQETTPVVMRRSPPTKRGGMYVRRLVCLVVGGLRCVYWRRRNTPLPVPVTQTSLWCVVGRPWRQQTDTRHRREKRGKHFSACLRICNRFFETSGMGKLCSLPTISRRKLGITPRDILPEGFGRSGDPSSRGYVGSSSCSSYGISLMKPKDKNMQATCTCVLYSDVTCFSIPSWPAAKPIHTVRRQTLEEHIYIGRRTPGGVPRSA